MADENTQLKPPYATFRSFMNFIDKLAETDIPSRVDRSVFGNVSGSAAYSIMSALKFLTLISAGGAPSEELRALVGSSGQDRKDCLKQVLRVGYPALFSDKVNLRLATSAQFDQLMRSEHGVSGSSLDKAASFFIAAAQESGLEISQHLKDRRPTAPSSASRKKKTDRAPKGENDNPPPTAQVQQSGERPLSHVLIDMLNMDGMSDVQQEAVWTLVQYQKRIEAKDSSG